jgi:predicted peptidase
VEKEQPVSQQPYRLETTITKNVGLDYLLYLPETYGEAPDERWPLVIFLHGMGERGADLELVKKHGIPKLVEAGKEFPFVAVSPQCPGDSLWILKVDALRALMDEIVDTYAVDPGRVYLTGLSMGGYGTWHWAATDAERFAAIAPICGGGYSYMGYPEKVCALKDVPVWSFHGAKDPVVAIEESEKMVNALQACGGDVQFTVYPDAEHDSWTETYENAALYEWLLRHRK